MGKILVTGKRLNLGVRGHDQVVPGVATLDRSPDQSPWVRPISPSHYELRGTRRGGPPGWSTDKEGPGVHTLEWIFF